MTELLDVVLLGAGAKHRFGALATPPTSRMGGAGAEAGLVLCLDVAEAEVGAVETAAATLATPAMLMALWLMTAEKTDLLVSVLHDDDSDVESVPSRSPTPSTPGSYDRCDAAPLRSLLSLMLPFNDHCSLPSISAFYQSNNR